MTLLVAVGYGPAPRLAGFSVSTCDHRAWLQAVASSSLFRRHTFPPPCATSGARGGSDAGRLTRCRSRRSGVRLARRPGRLVLARRCASRCWKVEPLRGSASEPLGGSKFKVDIQARLNFSPWKESACNYRLEVPSGTKSLGM